MIDSFIAIVLLIAAVAISLIFRRQLARYPVRAIIVTLAALWMVTVAAMTPLSKIYPALLACTFVYASFITWREWRRRVEEGHSMR